MNTSFGDPVCEHSSDGANVNATLGDFLRMPPLSYDVAAWFLHHEAVWAGGNLFDQHCYQAVRAVHCEIAARLTSLLPHPWMRTGMEPSSPP